MATYRDQCIESGNAQIDSLEQTPYTRQVLVPSLLRQGKHGPKHWSLPDNFSDNDASSPPQSGSFEEIIRMREELIQSRLQQAVEDSESRTDESVSNDNVPTGQKGELTRLARQASVATETLDELQKDGILERIPRNSNGELTSFGSLKHETNDCAPCLFWIQTRCRKSFMCTYCHMEQHLNEKSKPLRASKKTRDRLKKAREKASLELQNGVATSRSSQAQLRIISPALGAEARESDPARRIGKMVSL